MIYAIALLSALVSQAYAETFCSVAPSVAGDRRTNKNNLRILQYNAEWLFIDEFSGCPGTDCAWANETVAWEHLHEVSSVIATINPDIVNFCEIEGCDELGYVVDDLTGQGYIPYVLDGTDDYTGQNVGMITRIDPTANIARTNEYTEYPIPGSQCGYTGTKGTYGTSKNQIVTFNINGIDIAMFGMHLLAYPDDVTRCAEREAQITNVRNSMEPYISAGYEIIAIGDLNDFDGDVPDKNNNTPISQVLDIIKGDASSSMQLTSVGSLVDQSDRYTDWWDENDNCVFTYDEVSTIDHVLVSPNLLARITNVEFYHGYAEYCDTLDSDHWPIIVDFNMS